MTYWKWLIALLSASFFVDASESRFVTAGGTVTEIVFALGKGSHVVAIDQSSSYPAKAKQLPVVGYYRDLAAEGVLSTQLTHLLALEGSGRAKALEQINQAGVKVSLYPKPTTIDGLYKLIQLIADDIGASDASENLINQIKQRLPQPNSKRDKSGLFLLSAGERGLVAAGDETVPKLLFDYVGITNVAPHEGFKGMSIEALAMTQPDFIVAPKHVVEGLGGPHAFCSQPALALIEAAQNCSLLVMDSLLSLGMTPRIDQAIDKLNTFVETL